MMRHECDSTAFRRWLTGLEKGALPEFSIRDFVSVFLSGSQFQVLCFQCIPYKTRQLSNRAQARSSVLELPIFTQISLSLDARVPPVSPQFMANEQQGPAPKRAPVRQDTAARLLPVSRNAV
jgi:hypothetical protein